MVASDCTILPVVTMIRRVTNLAGLSTCSPVTLNLLVSVSTQVMRDAGRRANTRPLDPILVQSAVQAVTGSTCIAAAILVHHMLCRHPQ